MMTSRVLVICIVTLLSALSVGPASSAVEPSVLVTTAPLTRHTLVETLIGYGTVAPAAGHVENISTSYGGRVIALPVSPGGRVNHGDALIELATDPAASLAYRRAATAVEYARSELQRVEDLAQQRLATRSQVASARKSLADAKLRLRELKRLGAGRRTTTFHAPFDGVVISLAATVGERVSAGKTLLQLARTDMLRAQLGVEPADATRVRPGMSVRLASVFDARNTVNATVAQVHGMIDPQTQLVDVVVRFESDPASPLFPGTRVRGDITAGQHVGWAVPRQAVLRDARGAYLFQVQEGRARRVDVSTGIESGGLVGVTGSLDAKEPIVVLGNYELKDGMKVRRKNP